jgi:hypothetical protein
VLGGINATLDMDDGGTLRRDLGPGAGEIILPRNDIALRPRMLRRRLNCVLGLPVTEAGGQFH